MPLTNQSLLGGQIQDTARQQLEDIIDLTNRQTRDNQQQLNVLKRTFERRKLEKERKAAEKKAKKDQQTVGGIIGVVSIAAAPFTGGLSLLALPAAGASFAAAEGKEDLATGLQIAGAVGTIASLGASLAASAGTAASATPGAIVSSINAGGAGSVNTLLSAVDAGTTLGAGFGSVAASGLGGTAFFAGSEASKLSGNIANTVGTGSAGIGAGMAGISDVANLLGPVSSAATVGNPAFTGLSNLLGSTAAEEAQIFQFLKAINQTNRIGGSIL